MVFFFPVFEISIVYPIFFFFFFIFFIFCFCFLFCLYFVVVCGSLLKTILYFIFSYLLTVFIFVIREIKTL